ncbi:hypothetical protein V6Z12_A13G231100 [Gossypium hirsutum]
MTKYNLFQITLANLFQITLANTVVEINLIISWKIKGEVDKENLFVLCCRSKGWYPKQKLRA